MYTKCLYKYYFLSEKLLYLKTYATKKSGDVLFIGGPDHDFSYMNNVTPKDFYHGLDSMTKILTKLARSGASIVLDGVLYMQHKNAEFRELQAAQLLFEHMFSNQSLLAYIDMWNWVIKEGRSNCMKRDNLGIHFVNDYVRHLHVQALLNCIEYFQFRNSADTPASLASQRK